MSMQNLYSDLEILTVKQAQTRGLAPLTLVRSPDMPLRVGDGASSMRYIDWLAAEQERIRCHGDRQAEIVQDDAGKVCLWVDLVAA